MTTRTEEWIERYEEVSWNTFGRRRIALARGAGSRVWDVEGKEYLDFLTGIAVNNLGHCHPAIVEAIRKQAGELIHCTNIYYIPVQIELAEMLSRHSFGAKVFFTNSGVEANEGMLKLARKFAASKGVPPEKRVIVACKNSFHGRSLGTLSATGQEKFWAGFEPLLPGFKFVDYNDCAAMRAAVDDSVCAIIVEPVQGEGGVTPATQDFMDTLAALRSERGVLLLFDEIQTGLGRTGRNFAYEYFGVTPDIMTLAKPLAGGLAAGAVLARPEVAEAMTPGSHGGTMVGNPMACAGGKAYCGILFNEGLAGKARLAGEKIFARIEQWAGDIPCVRETRGLGMMIGVALGVPGAGVVERCERRGLLINCTAGSVIRLLPPLNVEDADIDLALDILEEELRREG